MCVCVCVWGGGGGVRGSQLIEGRLLFEEIYGNWSQGHHDLRAVKKLLCRY